MLASISKRVENIVGSKITTLVTSIFSFIPQFFQKPLSLPPSQTATFRLFQEFEEDNFEFDKNDRKLFKWVENNLGKGEISCY